MSFDLTLTPREGRSLDREEFFAYFENHNHTEQTGDEVAYSNEDTGVYFTLSFGERPDPNAPATEGRSSAAIYFNMNLMRPRTFALEAASVLSRLAEHFSLLAVDPQNDGMEPGAFDSEAFVRSWTGSNRWACRAIGELRGADRVTLPQALNEALWRWNHQRDAMSEDFMDELVGVFVPLVMYFRESGQARTFCIFPNLVPTAVPKVDRVLVTRDKLPAPHAKKSKPTPAWVTWEELVAAMSGYEIRGDESDDEHPHLILFREDDYESPESAPQAFAKWVIGLPDWPGRPDIISPDTILDAEVMRPADGE